MLRLPRKFYEQSTVEVACQLLGCYLIIETKNGQVGGKIVETEAYLADDPASQSFRGPTNRTLVMFGPAGYLYVYMTYGMHFCINVVTRNEGVGEAVLIRALEPTLGIEQMKKRRNKEITDLCRGPAKLTQALGLTLADNGTDLIEGKVGIYKPEDYQIPEIVITPRIGISKATDAPLRFFLKGGEQYVSQLRMQRMER